jgi:hypothetical protein
VETFADGRQVLLKSLEIYKLEPAKFLAITTRQDEGQYWADGEASFENIEIKTPY